MFPKRFHQRFPARDETFSKRRRSEGRRRPRIQPTAERLENRELLTVLVTYHGGQVIPQIKAVDIFYGWNGKDPGTTPQSVLFQNQIDAYVKFLAGSTYLGDLNQYGVGTGSLLDADVKNVHATIPYPADFVQQTVNGKVYPNAVLDHNSAGYAADPNNIQDMLNKAIADKAVPAPDANTFYLVWVGPGATTIQESEPGTPPLIAPGAFAGYHFFQKEKSLAYAVLPNPSPSNATAAQLDDTFDFMTVVASHEIGEGVTDPYFFGWYYQTAAGEIGDLTTGQIIGLGPYQVQRLWSNFIPQSNFPHALPLVSGDPRLPGVVRSPKAEGRPIPAVRRANPPDLTTPPPRPPQPAAPRLPGPIAPPSPNPTIPGGPSPVQPAIAADNVRPTNLALASQNAIQVSTDGGSSWSSPVAFPAPSAGDSSLVYDKSGSLHWLNLDSATRGIAIATVNPATGSIVGGAVDVDTPAAGLTDIQAFLAGDSPSDSPQSDNLFVAWTRLGPGNSSEILISRSSDRGATWSTPVAVSGTGEGHVYGATVSVASDGTVYVAYHSQPGFTVTSDGGIVPDGNSGQTFVARYSSDLTNLLSKTAALGPGQSDPTFNVQTGARKIAGATFLTQGTAIPRILADPKRPDTVYLVADDDPTNGTGTPVSRVIFAVSRQDGAAGTWTSSTLDAVAGASFQLFPAATIDKQGDLAIVWLDNRNGQTNASGHALLDTFAKYSVDGGRSWSVSFQTNPAGMPFDPDAGAGTAYGGPPATTAIGNSIGVAIEGGGVYVARLGNVYNGTTPTGQTAVVDSFAIPGSLTIPASPGNELITIRRMSSGSDLDQVLLNNVVVFTGPIESIAGGIVIGAQVLDFPPSAFPNLGNNDTLFLDFSNGDPIPAGGVVFHGAVGGNNVIKVNADADETLSDSGLKIAGSGFTTLDNVTRAVLIGGSRNDVYTLDGWTGTTEIVGGSGTNKAAIASGTVLTSRLSLSNVQTLDVLNGTLLADSAFSVPLLENLSNGTLDILDGVTLAADLTNAGLLKPEGRVTITGNFRQTSTGILDILISDLTHFGRLDIAGTANLDGTLNVALAAGYVPQSGDSFQILTYAIVIGDFASENLPRNPKFTALLRPKDLTLIVQ